MDLSQFKLLLPAILAVLASGNPIFGQILNQSVVIDLPIGYDEQILIRADGGISPTVEVVTGGALISPSNISVTGASTLVLDGGFLGDLVAVQDQARFVLLNGRIECVSGSCGDVPGLLPVLTAEDSAVLELHSSVGNAIHLSGNSVAEIVGRGLEVLTEGESLGARTVLIGSEVLADGSRDISIALRMRENSSYVLRNIPEPSSAAMMLGCSCCLLLARPWRRSRPLP